ncbi:ABC transporter transmembrane domain-containing protein [Roseobacter sinensis]|uniref:ABC transporter transmembrane domain-containing protein n=1 Tax=Roseobacter sinensis TaxID=2931391 RepID=A0ABT3BET7_9RHOB|nr:ABC transporter transmembrane domain-containing protein [Roseobacter sp. WL0113]MCV3272068.1 ABC transporter transmembrane domain-containing protein [Roseobacter sp. WL0113]
MGVRTIEKSLFQFIWKYSKRDQLKLLLITSTLFPFLYLTLELPKRIINDAIGAQATSVAAFGLEFTQLGFLFLLCAAFLASVLAHGLLKMRINTQKGILSERLLRRLRYTLISRMLRFPKAYFRRTSQGELVAMITGETEPMGGMMGDALTQPVLQAGQMLTILIFLFLQSVWFGLAAVALIPLQAWLIPRLQRHINVMNKERIKEVRQLAALIGESAAGASELRIHGGWRYRLSAISHRLGIIFGIRLRIYRKKFFMKFLNNFITQLTPFFFFSVGGYLVINGAVSLGALVAALAAYKDLSAPWKELLAFYNQAQDMSLRWETVTEKFSPTGVIDEALLQGTPDEIPRLSGAIALSDVTVTDADGNPVLEKITARFAPGSLVAIDAPSVEDRQALADVLTREVIPASGGVTVGDQPLAGLHQSVIAARIGHAQRSPVLFRGSLEDNAVMPLKPHPGGEISEEMQRATEESARAGAGNDPVEADWLAPAVAGFETSGEVRAWWHRLLQGMGAADPLYRRALDQRLDDATSAELAEALVAARPKVWEAVVAAGLDRQVYRFDPDRYNPALPVTSNLLFATMRRSLSQADLAAQTDLFELIRALGLEADLLELSRDVIALLHRIFGTDGTEHPLFRKLGLDPHLFEQSVALVLGRRAAGAKPLSDAEKTLLMTVPAHISAEQIGPTFTEEMQSRILDLRKANGFDARSVLLSLYAPLKPDKIAPGLTVLENALFGKISDGAGGRADELRRIAATVLDAAGLRLPITELIYDLPLSLGGADLPAVFAEPLAISRAAIKRPDILILDNVLKGEAAGDRAAALKRLRALLPETTMLYLGDSFDTYDGFDSHLEIRQGRMVSAEDVGRGVEEGAASADLLRKVRALETTPLFSGLNRKQLRLLAFGARWFSASAGDVIFRKADMPTDGAYMILSGEAVLYHPEDGEAAAPVAEVGPGTLVGELGVIRNVPRALTMQAKTDVKALRLGAEELLSVIENDAATAFKLLQVVAGYTS